MHLFSCACETVGGSASVSDAPPVRIPEGCKSQMSQNKDIQFYDTSQLSNVWKMEQNRGMCLMHLTMLGFSFSHV